MPFFLQIAGLAHQRSMGTKSNGHKAQMGECLNNNWPHNGGHKPGKKFAWWVAAMQHNCTKMHTNKCVLEIEKPGT